MIDSGGGIDVGLLAQRTQRFHLIARQPREAGAHGFALRQGQGRALLQPGCEILGRG